VRRWPIPSGLKELDPPDDVEVIGIVVKRKGRGSGRLRRRCAHAGFSVLDLANFFAEQSTAISEDAIEELEAIEKKADEAGLDTVVYISMAFGNPYGDPWSVEEVVEAVGLLELQEIRTISLADTVGAARPRRLGKSFPP